MAMRWYVLHVYSGFEKKIATQIKEQAELKGLADNIGDIIVPVEEVIIDPIHLARPRRARRARNRIDKVGRRPQVLAKRGLAGARGRGNDEKNSLAAKDGSAHSIFCTCSRNFSNSVFIPTMIWLIARKFALLPIVFVSRNIS